MSAEARLKQLGLVLPNVPSPVANYLPYRIAGNLLFLAGQGPAGAYVASLSPANRDLLRDRLRYRLTGEHGNGGGPFVLTARAWAVKGYSSPRDREPAAR